MRLSASYVRVYYLFGKLDRQRSGHLTWPNLDHRRALEQPAGHIAQEEGRIPH
jgi:hypothetical protein